MPESVEKRPSGLLVVTKAEKAAAEAEVEQEALANGGKLLGEPKKFKQLVGVKTVAGIQIVTPATFEEKHKLDPEARKQRREDNKAMTEIRQKTRGRKKHGRKR